MRSLKNVVPGDTLAVVVVAEADDMVGVVVVVIHDKHELTAV
jgi:hypothetical protein